MLTFHTYTRPLRCSKLISILLLGAMFVELSHTKSRMHSCVTKIVVRTQVSRIQFTGFHAALVLFERLPRVLNVRSSASFQFQFFVVLSIVT